MAELSSTFYRLERPHKDGYIEIVEFHTTVSGNTYFRAHEEDLEGNVGWIGKPMKITKDRGNKYYLHLKEQGYKFAGIYEMDRLGYKTLKEGK